MQALYDRLLALRERVMLEGVEREKIKLSEEYLQLQREIEQIQGVMKLMVSSVPDSSVELEDAKVAVMEAMQQQGIDNYGIAKVTYREKNRVNVSRVLEVVGGDIGHFLEMANITQKTVKDYAKLMPEIKRDLLGCIELVDREVTGLTHSEPQL